MPAPTIITRTIAAASEVAASISNAAIARSVFLPAGWTKIRVGARLHTTNSGAALGGTPRFAFGLCKGTSNILGAASVDHFAGLITTEATWSLQAGPFYGGNTCAPAKKVGASLTVGANFSINSVYPANAAAAGADRVLHFIDITKGSPNYTFQAFMQNSGTIGDVSAATFLAQMQAATPVLSNHAQSAGVALAVDEGANGTFDAVQWFCDQPTIAFELCDIAVVQLA